MRRGKTNTFSSIAADPSFLSITKTFLLVFLMGTISVALSGCILPPARNTASVLSQEELEIVSTVSLAKDYSKSGRMDLAEAEFRKALILSPNSSNIQNDLAYVLQSQNRLDEAKELYLQTLTKQPDNIVARDNLARLYFQKGEFRAALLELLRLIDSLNEKGEDKLRKEFGDTVGNQEIISAYRKLATIYYTVGVYDDARCYSALAHRNANSVEEAGLHIRLLLSLDLVKEAMEVLTEVVSVHGDSVPAKLMLDYSLALFLTGNEELAGVAVKRVLAASGLDGHSRKSARILTMILANKSGVESELQAAEEALTEDDPEWCENLAKKIGAGESIDLDVDNYWPLDYVERVSEVVKKLCDEEIKSVISGA